MYEIPQQLEYKEKIVFGLTFSQLAYAFVFFPISFLIFFKWGVNIYVRFIFALFPCLLGIGFIFFDLGSKLKKWITWYRLREMNLKEKIEQFFAIKKIDDNLIFTQKEKLAVLKIDSINFQIKPEKEQETITLAFQKFLNSLDFPIQILMTTENLSIKDYFKSLESRINNEHSKEIFEEYKTHMQEIISENSVSNRNFYVVIPEKTDIDIQIKICEERLNGLNLRTQRLHNKQLTALLTQLFNISNKDTYLPEKIENKPSHVKINDKFSRTIYAHGYPRIVESGFLDKIVSSLGDFNLSLHIEPLLLEQTMIILNKELQKQRADLYSAKIKNQLNPSLQIQYKDTLKTLENLQKGNEKLFNVSLYINCKADTEKELDLLTKKVESELNSLLIIPKQADFRMIQGFKSCLPLNQDSINMRRNITTTGLSAFFPFTSSFLKIDDTGIWFGLNKNKIPIIRDIFKLSNANGICLASSGAGKSYMAKLFISRYLLNGNKVIVIDPQGEYKNLVKKFNGQLIDLSRTSNTIINPLDLMGHDYPEKRLTLMDLMPVMLGDISEPQKAILDKALTETYERKGIYMNDRDSWGNEPPILSDLLKILENIEKKATSLEKTTIRSLMNRLNLYVTGVFSFLNKHTKIDFNNKFVCVDIGNLPKQVKPIMMFLVLDYVYTKMKGDLERKLLVIDEAWSLLSKTHEASYIFEIVKTCRKFNLGLFLINQEVEDMLNSKAGRSVLANSSYTILLKQKPAVIDDIQKVFHLSSSERIALLTALLGEGILIIEDEHSNLKIIASKKEHDLITTNADEILANGKKPIERVIDTEKIVKEDKNPVEEVKEIKILETESKIEVKKPELKQKKKAQKKKKELAKRIDIKVDESQRFFRKKDLNENEVKYLLAKNYVISKQKSINSEKEEYYLLKPRFKESEKHFFVMHDIANYLNKNKINAQISLTKTADVIFILNNKRQAIEVETGAVLSNVNHLKTKIELLNQGYDEWFFVVTNRNKVKNYSRFGKTIDLRYLKTNLDKIIKTAKN